jgi:hypothetical protein
LGQFKAKTRQTELLLDMHRNYNSLFYKNKVYKELIGLNPISTDDAVYTRSLEADYADLIRDWNYNGSGTPGVVTLRSMFAEQWRH